MLKNITNACVILLVSCNTISPVPIYHLNLKLNACFIHCYSPEILSVVDDSACGIDFISGQYPVEKCDKIIGFQLDYYAGTLRGAIREKAQACRDVVEPYSW